MSKGPGMKFDTVKPKYSLLPWSAIELVVWVLMFGAEKYGENNWQNIEDGYQRYLDAAQRHMKHVFEKQSEGIEPPAIRDHESKMATIAHAACDLLFSLWFLRDDLPKEYDVSWVKEHFAKMREEYTQNVKTDSEGNATKDSATTDTDAGKKNLSLADAARIARGGDPSVKPRRFA